MDSTVLAHLEEGDIDAVIPALVVNPRNLKSVGASFLPIAEAQASPGSSSTSF